MNGMLPNHDIQRDIVDRHQHETRERAESDRRGRLARSSRETVAEHERGARFLAVIAPVATLVAVFLVLI